MPRGRPPKKIATIARKAFAFEGMVELQSQLSAIINEVSGKEMKAVYVGAAKILADEARRNLENRPFSKTGNLKRSIFHGGGDPGASDAIVGIHYGRTTQKQGATARAVGPHAHLVEFGHAGPHPAPPHPFMRPAVMSKAQAIKGYLTDGFGAIIKKFA